MPETQRQKFDSPSKPRESGVELLKIFAVVIIVFSHVVATLTDTKTYTVYPDYIIDVSRASGDMTHIVLLIFRQFGIWGDSLFFVCSAWFLLKAGTFQKKKWFFLLVEVWIVSIIFLTITYVHLQGRISTNHIIMSIFPTLFSSNWYLTCYLLFYPLSPILNGVINRMSKKELFRSALVLATLYLFLCFIKGKWFFNSVLIMWVAVYFVVAYVQKYLMAYAENVKLNVLIILLSAIGLVGLIILTEIVGLRFSFLSGMMLHWEKYCNPFFVFISIAMLNIARKRQFNHRWINYVSSLSLLIYIIHENLILRRYYRPLIWKYIKNTFGYDHVIGWAFAIAFIIYVLSVMAAVFFKETAEKHVRRASDHLYGRLSKKYLDIEKKVLKNF